MGFGLLQVSPPFVSYWVHAGLQIGEQAKALPEDHATTGNVYVASDQCDTSQYREDQRMPDGVKSYSRVRFSPLSYSFVSCMCNHGARYHGRRYNLT
jgi:hypothetical protein